MKPKKYQLMACGMLLITALLFACTVPAMPPAATPVRPTPSPVPPTPTSPPGPLAPREGLRPDAPEFARHGPFWVGYKSLVIGKGTDRPLEAGIWYPALNPGGAREEITYTLTLKAPVTGVDPREVVYGHALRQAELNLAAAPYPLVVFSPGFTANAAIYNTLLEHYASHGFIVIAPEHLESSDNDLWKASIDRPIDIKRTLDHAAQSAAPGGDMAGRIDMRHVAVVGHSYGGYTALAMAGAQYDLAAFNARCAQLPVGDPNTFLCAPLILNESSMAERAGIAPKPAELWPSFGDPRVTAIIPIAGDSYLFDKAGLSKITVPMMAIGGTADTGTPYDWGAKPSYDYASSAKKALVTFEGAEHSIAISPCENMPWFRQAPFYQWVCFDPAWDRERALDLVKHFSTAFLLDTLKRDAAAAAALAPQNVTFQGIKYETTASP
jgi:predicted dienelactone hydrolase